MRVLDVAVKNPAKVKEELAVQVRDAVNTMRKNDVDLSNSLFWITGSTLLFGEIATINQHSFRVPVLSTVTDVVQDGDDSAVLSVGISFESNAHQAAIYAADVLEDRRKVGALPVGVVSPPDVAISFRKAREIGMKIPFSLFESATTIYDNDGKLVRSERQPTYDPTVTRASVSQFRRSQHHVTPVRIGTVRADCKMRAALRDTSGDDRQAEASDATWSKPDA